MSTFTVTNTNNSGAGSLRQAVLDANALTGKDIINFSGLFTDGLAHTISLNGSGLSITDNLTIEGTNPSLLTIKDDSADRVFDIGKGVTAAINGLTINNSYNGLTGGGGISNEGVLTLSNSIITGNTVYENITDSPEDLLTEGGGIYNTGSLTVNYSNILANFCPSGGGGIYNTGTVNVSNSTISDNVASLGSSGGGIYNTGTVNVSNSTISDNNGTGYGGGIFNGSSDGILRVNYSTITGNGGNGLDGGGICNFGGTVTVSYSTISNNSSSFGGGIGNGGTMTVSNCTISNNSSSFGGGIDNDGTMTVSNSKITANFGGGIYNEATMTVGYSTLSDNQAIIGGGILNYGDLSLSNSAISNNHASEYGGGIYNSFFVYSRMGNQSGIITVSYSSISGNTALTAGGGIYNNADDRGDYSGTVTYDQLGFVTLSNSTISGNQAHFGGGIYNTGILTVGNSIIRHNKAFGIELSSGSYESGDGGGIYNSSHGTATVDYSTIACNFDTPQEDSSKYIKVDDLVGKFISKGHDNWIGNLSGSTFSYS
ncbi:MAG: hypothetical protein V7K86_27825 [Nostoc sp.]|uniref:beta strand repeat-containing protein n=1 Tax=Nostoc sp. TaxID=1180 RepID=UPI002FF4D8B7